MQMAQEPLKVGDKLWLVENYRSRPDQREVEVTKIGRKWATIGAGWREDRIDLIHWRTDPGNSVSRGRCYRDRAAYEAHQALREAWSYFASRISRNDVPGGITIGWIDATLRELGLPPRPMAS